MQLAVTLGALSVVRSFFDRVPEWWWTLRLAVWLFVTFTFTSMVWLPIVRRFFPSRLRTSPDESTLLPRHEAKRGRTSKALYCKHLYPGGLGAAPSRRMASKSALA